jgi:hypothetical protein
MLTRFGYGAVQWIVRLQTVMPIPPFDGILNVLPPHLGDPRLPSDLSPYACTMQELCNHFATSPARKQILEGFLNLRADLFALGVQGFQWLDGSFVEDIETQEGRDPKDIDVVTFVEKPLDPMDLNVTVYAKPELWMPNHSKTTYFVDHYLVSLGSRPDLLVAQTRYWYALFSHRRDDQWKGMLTIDLRDKTDDDAARLLLRSKP